MTSSSDGSNSSASLAPSRSISKDLIAGFLVFLIALPLCLATAMASGFPPAAGLLTAIAGSIVVGLFAGAPLTSKGPALGLIVVALAAVTELGQGDAVAGYRYTLAVGVVAAVIQIGLALTRVGTAFVARSPAVVHGMLAALGITVVAKLAHTAFGAAPQNQATLAVLVEIPSSIAHADPKLALIGLASLVILFGLPLARERIAWLAKLPAHLVVVLVAVALGFGLDLGQAHYARGLAGQPLVGDAYLVHLPGALIKSLALPDFAQITSPTSIKYVVSFALVGSIESTVAVTVTDSIDPAKRRSDRKRDLLAVGIGNLLCSAIGALPMVSELVRSKANVEAGASSRLANVVHGLLLLGVIALVPLMLKHLPLVALAAMLVHGGAQLVGLAPLRSFRSAGQRGWQQLMLFAVTLLVSLFSDLLIGVAVGLLLQLGLTLARRVLPSH